MRMKAGSSMKTRLPEVLLDLELRAGLCAFYPSAAFRPSLLKRRRGQNTVEYILLLAVVAGMAVMMGIMFHKKILGGIFTMVGMIIGAGAPK